MTSEKFYYAYIFLLKLVFTIFEPDRGAGKFFLAVFLYPSKNFPH